MTYDLENLRFIGWAVLMLSALGVGLFEGITSGALILLPGIDDDDERVDALLRTIAPGALLHSVWLLFFLLVAYAAWPIAFAVGLNSFKTVLLVIVLLLMLRLPALYFYQDLPQKSRRLAKKLLTASGVITATGLGLLAGNILKGVPFHLDSDMRIAFLGDVMTLFNPFALLVAVSVLALLAMHGASSVALRSTGPLQDQADALQRRAGIAFTILLALTGLWITHLEGYHVTSDILPSATSNPLSKFVKRSDGLWLDNYEHEPGLVVLPALAFIACGLVIWLSRCRRRYWAMVSSTVCVAMSGLTFGVSLFPFLLPSNLSLNSSLTIWDSSASLVTLSVVVYAAGVGLPVLAILSRWSHARFAWPMPEISEAIADN